MKINDKLNKDVKNIEDTEVDSTVVESEEVDSKESDDNVTVTETVDIKDDLRNTVTLMSEGNREEASIAFSSFINEKAKVILNDVKAGDDSKAKDDT